MNNRDKKYNKNSGYNNYDKLNECNEENLKMKK